MTIIAVKGFDGMKPIINPLLLKPNEAQLARNVRLISGAIQALRGSTTLKATSLGSPQTIFRYGSSATETNYWLEWSGDVDVVRSPIAQDQWDRLYWTDGVKPKYAPNNLILSGASYPGGSYTLGIPAPSTAPVITASTAVVEYTKVTRTYLLTYYNPTTNKESSASSPFTVTAVDGFNVKLTLPTTNGGDAGITKKRLYRKVGATYRRVAELDVATAEYSDAATDASLATATALATGVEARPSAPTVAPIAAASTVVTSTPAGISRQYLYTVKNVSSTDAEGNITYFEESVGSNTVSVTADSTQSVTVAGMASTGVTVVGAATFRVYRKDANDSLFRFVGESTAASFTDVIANNPSPTTLPAYNPDANSAIKPTAAPTASASTSTATTVVKRAYAVTFVDASGNESSISPVSNVVDAVNGQTTVTVRHAEGAPSGTTKRRLYRQTVTVTDGQISIPDSAWKLVIENTANSTSFSDNIADAGLGAALPSALQGLPTTPASGSATGEIPAAIIPETRTYVYTYVSAYGEEGPPSAASAVVTLDPTKAATVSLPSSAPTGSYNITLKRIYRSSTVGNQAKFQYVAEVPVATGSYIDEKKQADLLEVLPSEDWVAPPDGLKGLRMMANGVAVGFVGNTVHFSEPYLPHAWPHEYTVEWPIVGLATFGQTTVVLTNAFPYMMQGVDPAAMSSTRIELRQACVSKRSIVENGDGCLYASPDGLVSIGVAGARIITQGLLSRDDWQAYNPSSMQGFLYNDKYHCFYTTTGGTRGLIVFDFTGQGASMTVSDFGAASAVVGGFQDATTDTLYLVQGNSIVRFDRGTNLTYLWRSKVFRLPAHSNLGAAQVRASAYPLTMRIYADGVLKHTQTVISDNHFRLPSGFKALDWYFELEGTSEVTEVFISKSASELMAA